MNGRVVRLAVALVQIWTQVYTYGLEAPQRQRRQAEIDSDLWEFREDAVRRELRDHIAATAMIARLVLGMPDDLPWRWEETMNGAVARRTPWWLTTPTLAVCLASVWLLWSASTARWLAHTSWSAGMQDSVWMFPVIGTLHIMGLCVLIGLAAVIDLRLLGVTLRSTTVSEVATWLLPWTMSGFGMVIVSGVLMYLVDPLRYSGSTMFQFKLALLLVAGVNGVGIVQSVYRRGLEWDRAARVPNWGQARQRAVGVALGCHHRGRALGRL